MDTTSGSYTWQAPAEMMEEAVKQVRKEMVVQENVRKSSTPKAREVRQSVIKEWTEEQLLMILVDWLLAVLKPMLYFEMCKSV